MSKLAIFGGPKVRTTLFPSQNTMDENEKNAVLRVLENGRLSGYRANKGEHFFGGPEIQGLEKEWRNQFNIITEKSLDAIACNSATSGLFIACKAIDLQPNDEVIVTPYSMTCSATIPTWFGAKPVFADVESKYFCIDPISVSEKITEKTRAIIAVDIFGQPCDYDSLKRIVKIAEQRWGNKIYIISDTAQAPGSIYKANINDHARYSGTIVDIGVFSLNFGKHMTCGEGGMIIANNDILNERCRMIMNHAESVNNDYDIESDLIGLNLRMTELQAAVAREQLKKLNDNIETRKYNVFILSKNIVDIPAISIGPTRPYCKHVYYVDAYLWDSEKADGLHRDKYIEAVKAELTPREGRDGEGVQIGCGYIKPIYKMPWAKGKYDGVHLPVVENLWENELFLTLLHAPNSTKEDMYDVAEAFNKVWKYREELMK